MYVNNLKYYNHSLENVECFKTKYLSVDNVQKVSINRHRRLFLFSNIKYKIHTKSFNHTFKRFVSSFYLFNNYQISI